MRIHYHLLINPASGSGTSGKKAEKLIQLFDKKNLLYTPYYTQAPGDERKITARLAEAILKPWRESAAEEYTDEPFPLLVVFGGDGTLHEALNQLYDMNLELPVSYIPTGSGNDFARSIGISRDPEKAFLQLLKVSRPQMLNVLTYQEGVKEEQGVAMNNFGIGLDARIVATTNASTSKEKLNKYHLGSLSYMLYLLHALFTQKTFSILVEANGKQYSYPRAFLCTTTNIPYFGGGIAIAPMADPKKPRIDLVVVEKPNMAAIIRFLLQLLRKKHVNNRHYQHLSSKKLRIIVNDFQYGQADGESLPEQPFDIRFSTKPQLFWY